MKKNIFKNNVSEIKKISEKMPKTINEAINFDEFDEEDEVPMEVDPEVEPEPAQDVEVEKPAEPAKNEASEKAKKLIDDIRKMSLRAMAELADTPECPEYENLKRIWQLCDKAVSEKQEQRDILQKAK
jgi:hypothetical protein